MSTPETHTPDGLERVEDLWFEDGNLILQAENSLFRIYSGFLSARSSVFSDMLAFPPPPEGNEKMDDCYIVSVYDSAKDMTVFLKAIIDSSYFEPPPSHTKLHIVEGVLRLSLKYDVQYLHRRALKHLKSTFPQSLEDWKKRDFNRTIPPLDNTPFAALRIAREFDLTWLLPSIYYCISSHPLDKTLDGVKWEGEDLQLSWIDKRTSLIGRANILQLQSRNALMLTKLASVPVGGCTSTNCPSTRARYAEMLAGWAMAGLLDYFEDNNQGYSVDFCSTCRVSFKEQCEAASQDLWNELPDMFELPGWTELKRHMVLASE
ncbi:hypothetical protein BYT27DRAFT_7234211 [Phlegmacium glaucopus]|nr:hypothetical protein BYT27DRAFT_7234211 [Phlegmacium glaucopus]